MKETVSGAAPARAAMQRDNFLGRPALQLLATLPADVFPCALARQFPRIVNQLALHGSNVSKTERYLQGLLVSERPGRQGFPTEVVRELIALSAHYERAVSPARIASVWDSDPHPLRH